MELSLINQLEHPNFEAYEEDFLHIMKETFSLLNVSSDVTMSVILVDDDQIHEVNRTYRNIDRPTDVITFALHDSVDDYETEMMGEIEAELGDIFINQQAVERQASEYGHSVRREMCFLFTHGLLHLLGYDHMCEEDEKVMFDLQHQILDQYIPREK